MHYGDTVVLSTATASEKPRDGIDFFPLSVEYEEKLYAVGKIPGGYLKREGKPSENAILTDRVIDRPMRPLFPKDYRNDVALNNLVMSVDPDCSPELTAMLGSAIATAISDIPFDGPTASTMVGLIDGEFVINPTSTISVRPASSILNCFVIVRLLYIFCLKAPKQLKNRLLVFLHVVISFSAVSENASVT